MKKALIVLLILAVAGGLFAQVTFSGSVNTGLGIGFSDEDGDKAKVDYIRNRGEQGIRGDFTVKYASPTDAAYGPFGAEILFRVRQNDVLDKGDAARGILPYSSTLNLWYQPISVLTLYLGTGGPNNYGTMGGIDRNLGIGDDQGLKAVLKPIPGLAIAAHAFYGTSLKLFENMNYGFGATYAAPDLLTVAANARYRAEKDEGAFDFGAGVNYVGLKSVGLTKLAADVATWNLGASDAFLGFGPAIGFAVGDLSLGAKAQFFTWMGDGDPALSMPMLFNADASYKTGIAKIGVEGRYTIGGAPSLKNYRPATENYGIDSAASFANKDGKGFAVSPYVELSVGPTIVLGYNFRKNLTEGATGRTSESLIYAGVNIGF